MSTSNHTVIIPTAGLGSRLGLLSKQLNKSLIPYLDKPVIAHIIEQFPIDTRFIIPVGYKADQVKDFCRLAYSDRNIEFIEIDDYTSPNSGPGYTVSKCLDSINEPFWYIPCDTYLNESIIDRDLSEDVYFTKQVSEELTYLYTMFNIVDNRIVEMTFKQAKPNSWVAFTGVMHIQDWKSFKNRLLALDNPEIIWTIKMNSRIESLDTWLDFGNIEIYRDALNKSQKYDFTKTDEVTYICNNKVAKWWADESIPKKKYNKALSNLSIFPPNCLCKRNWMVYDYVPGTVVYNYHNPTVLTDMLNWLDKKVWIKSNIDISKNALEFYKTKTINRINNFLAKYPNIQEVDTIDGIAVKSWNYYLDHIDWNLLTQINLPGFAHGDLQFDNIIIDNTGKFYVIDWRHEFAGLVEVGDIYYDLAKLTGGFIINYSQIKQNDFNIEINNRAVTLDIPSIENNREYIDIVKKFVENKGWSYNKVALLIPIIFWNMAPLHTPPFDKFLWYLGIKFFEELKL